MSTAPFRNFSVLQWLRVAAAVSIVIGIAAIIRTSIRRNSEPIANLEYKAGSVEESYTLLDGSIVELQPHAQLICPAKFEPRHRDVKLNGDAYFSIIHDASRPFQVSVNDVKVKVLGTTFKIFGSPDYTAVIVVTGLVQVTKEDRTMKVFPHERLVVPASGDLWIKHSDTLPTFPSLPTMSVPKAKMRKVVPAQGTMPAAPVSAEVPSKSIDSPTIPAKPVKPTKKMPQIVPAAKQIDTLIGDYSHHQQIMASIINDLIKEGLVRDRKSIVWTALTSTELILDGKPLPDSLHQKLKEKYHITPEEGYYYGSVQVFGKGYFFNRDDFKQ